jgi:hypothetical protein
MQTNAAGVKLPETSAADERGQEVVIARGGQPIVRTKSTMATGARSGPSEGVVPPEGTRDVPEPTDEGEIAGLGR